MTPTRPCTHGMPSPASCIVCMDEGNIAPGHDGPGPEAMGRPFPAKFDGDCPGCDLVIHEGQPIRRWSDGRYRHEGCDA